MGASLSQPLRRSLVRATLAVLAVLFPPLARLVQRIAADPGIPVPSPCRSYWTIPLSPIASHGSALDAALPEHADIVILGSGITGTSVARTILDSGPKRPLHVVMLEARDACSGATARNGGHITPVLYQDYASLKLQHGPEIAAQIVRFRLSHLAELLAVASQEGLLVQSQCRRTRSFDAFNDPALFCRAKALLNIYAQDLPAEGSDYQVIECPAALADLQLSPRVVGCLSNTGGAVHPYRLVTGILARLLQSYPSSFQLFTHTPCIRISSSPDLDAPYLIHTPRSSIRARHVIHATNAWVSHLLPELRNKIVPARGVMTAQLPRPGFGKTTIGDWTGMRSFVLHSGTSFTSFDYLTQQLPTAPQTTVSPASSSSSVYPPPSAELMLGGGFTRNHTHLTEIGNADDSGWNPKVADYLSSSMNLYFRVGDNDQQQEAVVGKWSGIFAMSADGRPWVGRVPERIALRRPGADKLGQDPQSSDETLSNNSANTATTTTTATAPPGEWIAAGYSGEGMVHAWLSGKALACMVLGLDHKGRLPEVFRITEARCASTGLEEMVTTYVL